MGNLTYGSPNLATLEQESTCSRISKHTMSRTPELWNSTQEPCPRTKSGTGTILKTRSKEQYQNMLGLFMICNVWYNVTVHCYEIYRFSSGIASYHKPRSLCIGNQKSVKFTPK